MNGWYDPENLLDLIDHLILAAAGVGVVAIPSWLAARNHRELKTTQATVTQVRDQVVNGHADAPPLRADLDRVIAAIDRLSNDVTAIRRDLADEESRRRDHVSELREELHRKVDDLHKRFAQ